MYRKKSRFIRLGIKFNFWRQLRVTGYTRHHATARSRPSSSHHRSCGGGRCSGLRLPPVAAGRTVHPDARCELLGLHERTARKTCKTPSRPKLSICPTTWTRPGTWTRDIALSEVSAVCVDLFTRDQRRGSKC